MKTTAQRIQELYAGLPPHVCIRILHDVCCGRPAVVSGGDTCGRCVGERLIPRMFADELDRLKQSQDDYASNHDRYSEDVMRVHREQLAFDLASAGIERPEPEDVTA